MEDYVADTYGDRVASFYDDLHPYANKAQTDLLYHYANGGCVLELAIGTGRVALPLVDRGLDVHGVDISEAMLNVLRSKPGGAAMTLHRGDIANFDLDREFSVIVLVFNGLFFLVSQEEQLKCFECVAAHLAPEGRFVVETETPWMLEWQMGQHVVTRSVDVDGVELECARHLAHKQIVEFQRFRLSETGIKRAYPVKMRYAHHSEIDLMARISGLTLEERWSDWRGSPVTRGSRGVVSTYRRQ